MYKFERNNSNNLQIHLQAQEGDLCIVIFTRYGFVFTLQFLKDRDKNDKYSTITGKKIKMKVKKTRGDKQVCYFFFYS